MIGRDSTLADVCFAVADALRSAGIEGVLTGGSAAALYAPNRYMSYDADFILEGDAPLDRVAAALDALGFTRHGRSRIFGHPICEFTVDFPKGPLAVGGDFVRETHVLERDGLQLRVLRPIDCIRDRLSHFYYWNDFTALEAAVSVGVAHPPEVDLPFLRAWTEREDPTLFGKLGEFERRLERAVSAEDD